MKTPASIYASVRGYDDRVRIKDLLNSDGFEITTFASAGDLWEHFLIRPVRFVITDQGFGQDIGGLEVARNIREFYPLPYVYILLRSVEEQLSEIKEAIAAGVDDYIIKPPNPFQIRSRVLVGMRWLDYLDSLHAKLGNSTPLPFE